MTLANIRRALTALLLALWWGGFTIYAGRVVFIAHEVLHSRIRQGFVTERVTTELNWFSVAALVFTGWELLATSRASKRITWTAWSLAVVCNLALFALHAKLARMLDFSARQVIDDQHFYGWHRVYLLVATLEWIAVAVLVVWVACANAPSQRSIFPRRCR